MMRTLRAFVTLLICAALASPLNAMNFGAMIWSVPSQPIAGAACVAGVLDTFAASPGAWTFGASMRKIRAAYGGKALQLQRSTDGATLDVGFNGCDPDTSAVGSFCSTATLAVGASSARVALPAGSVVHIMNTGSQALFYAAGNSTVTASPSSSPLNFNQGDVITVGASTFLAAAVGSGYGTDGNTTSSLFITNCGISKFYDQVNGNDLTPIGAGLAKQMGFNPTCSLNGLPCAFGCLAGCGLKAPDAAVYKTATVETFTVMTFGEDITTSNFFYNGVGYPTTTTAAASNVRWGLINTGYPDLLTNLINGNTNNNAEGFGGIWRGQFLSQFDYSTAGITRWNGGTQFMNTGGATPTYPNAVGLYVMGDAAGHGTPGTFAETLVASGTQSARNSISSNQVSYFGISSGTASTVALTNPLGDGFNWNRIQTGSFAPQPPGPGAFTLNGNAFNSESAWNTYSQYQCSNCTTSAGQLGDLWRFQVTSFDNWDGTTRSELDGANNSAQFNNGTTYWLSWAVYVEPGAAYSASWNITGQMHAAGSAPICCVFNVNLQNDQWIVHSDDTNTGTETTQYTSPTITRGRWYHFVFQVLVSTTGTGDTMNVWLDPVTAGTMTQVVALSGASLFGGNTNSTLSYWKFGNYRIGGVILPTFAIRYGNMQVCAQGTGCTTLYGASDLSARTTTPLADPAHL